MKAAIFLAKGYEEVEAVGIIDVLRRGGINLDIISIAGSEMVEGAHGISIRTDKTFYQVDYNLYDMILLPGGMPGTRNLGAHEDLCKLIVDFHKQKKWLCAICAAPSVFGRLGILEGEHAVCYPGFEKELKGASISEMDVCVSNHFITGKGPGVVLEFSYQVLEQIGLIDMAAQLRKGMIAIR